MDIWIGQMVEIFGEWFIVEEISEDKATIWCSDEDGRDFEFPINYVGSDEDGRVFESPINYVGMEN